MVQVGGSHYEDMEIQPWEIIEKNGLDFWEGNTLKYLLRWRHKNGIEDLLKARDYLDHLINLEVGKLEPVVPSDKQSGGLVGSGHSGIFYTADGPVSTVVGVSNSKER